MGKNNLERFLAPQEDTYDIALSEIRNGRKESHWMWFIFPQILGLGYSSTAATYGIANLDEAKAYLKHPILGKRLIEISEELLLLPYRDPAEIFGYVDSIKLRSSMTLFHLADPTNHIFRDVLSKFFGGEIDQLTVSLLKSETAI